MSKLWQETVLETLKNLTPAEQEELFNRFIKLYTDFMSQRPSPWIKPDLLSNTYQFKPRNHDNLRPGSKQ